MIKTVKIQNRGWEEVEIPSTPNFVRRPSDGFSIPVGELTESQIRTIGKAWLKELIEKSARAKE